MMRRRRLLFATLVILGLVGAAAVRAQRTAEPGDLQFTVAGQRLTDKISSSTTTFTPSEGLKVLVLTLQCQKPSAQQIDLFTTDFILAYHREGKADRSRCQAIREAATTQAGLQDQPWYVGDYAGGPAENDDVVQSGSCFFEVAFPMEDDVDLVELRYAMPHGEGITVQR